VSGVGEMRDASGMSGMSGVTTGVPVLVVGAGPAGLATALALGRHGTACELVEARSGVGGHPRATGVRTRTMELFRQWGIETAVQHKALPAPDGPEFAWVHTVAGEEIGRLVVGGGLGDRLSRLRASPARTVFCPQDRIEPVMLDAVRAQSSVGVRLGTEVTGLEIHDEGGVTATLRDVHTGAVRRLRARYAVACDGAGSPARTAAGIALEGSDLAAEFLSVYFEADLRPWVGATPPMLHWILNSRSSGGLITLDGRHRWLLQAAQPAAGPHDEERCARIVRDAVGVDDLDVTVRRVLPWRMKSQVARAFRRGDLFLAGDAAHRFPPTGGFGMNSGIQDAHNLAWKLHLVLEGRAGPGLLDTYEQERRPVAEFNSGQSSRNAAALAETGFGPGVYDVAAELESADGESAGEARRRIRAALPRQLSQFDALGQDLGFRYDEGALVPDGVPVPSADERQLRFTALAAPGFRAPHHVLHRDGRALSTLDLFGDSFVLLAAREGEGWVRAAREASAERRLPLDCQRVAPDAELADLAVDSALDPALDPRADSVTWEAAYGTGPSGACLIRPDGHVAWRTDRPAPPSAARVLGRVLDRVLYRG
jgi:putative polyketide hydroxylase